MVRELRRHLVCKTTDSLVKSLGIDSCLYEIPKNDLVDDMSCSLWPSVTFPESRCVGLLLPHRNAGRLHWEKLKAYNFVIPGWVEPLVLQVPKRNSGYDSHDATSPYFPPPSSDFCPFPFNEGLGISPWQNCRIKDVYRLVLEHFDGLMRLIIFP